MPHWKHSSRAPGLLCSSHLLRPWPSVKTGHKSLPWPAHHLGGPWSRSGLLGGSPARSTSGKRDPGRAEVNLKQQAVDRTQAQTIQKQDNDFSPTQIHTRIRAHFVVETPPRGGNYSTYWEGDVDALDLQRFLRKDTFCSCTKQMVRGHMSSFQL